eukprot:SAG31_NODE_2381_length_5829_cov_4.002967_4_plen_112_part_00
MLLWTFLEGCVRKMAGFCAYDTTDFQNVFRVDTVHHRCSHVPDNGDDIYYFVRATTSRCHKKKVDGVPQCVVYLRQNKCLTLFFVNLHVHVSLVKYRFTHRRGRGNSFHYI